MTLRFQYPLRAALLATLILTLTFPPVALARPDGAQDVNANGGDFNCAQWVVRIPAGVVPDGSYLHCGGFNPDVAPAAPSGVTLLRYTINVNIYGPDDQWVTTFNPPLTFCASANQTSLAVQTAAIGAMWNTLPTTLDSTTQRVCANVTTLTATLFDLSTTAPTSAPPAVASAYLVQPGDTLYRIAQRYGITVNALVAANRLATTDIFIGQRLALPGPSAPAPTLNSAPVSAASTDYVVQSGDTLFRIALRFGVKVSALQAANKLNTTLLLVGQRLVIPSEVSNMSSPGAPPAPVAWTPPPATTLSSGARVPILEYHASDFYMSPEVMMTTAWFNDQMQWLADNDFVTLTANEFLAVLDGSYTPPARAVVLSFDLGTPHYDNYTDIIIPALRQHNFHALFFVTLNAVNDDCSYNYVCWSALRAWQAEGLISVQSHGVSHPDYATLTLDQIRADAGLSKTTIETQLGTPVTIFAYPYDSLAAQAPAILSDLGYRAALAGNVSGDRSARQADSRRFGLPRYYPYSGLARYPLLLGTSLTFGELLLQAVIR